MLDPLDLLAVARLLAADAQPSEAQLRRAVSTAYYALFHRVLQAAAGRFMGLDQETSAGYALIYQSFDHRHMKAVCEGLDVATLKDSLKRQLGRTAVSRDMRDFASNFPRIQEARHSADYDPQAVFPHADVLSFIDTAAIAIEPFNRTADDEQADVLALMLVRARG